MRRLLLLVLVFAAAAALALPLAYLFYAADLPDLSGPDAIRAALAHRVESERMATATVGTGHAIEKFEVLPRGQLPAGLVQGLIALEACPEYFQAPKERGLPRLRRLAGRLFLEVSGGEPGPGRCQFRFADLIGESVGVADPIHAAIANHRILEALSLEELVTFRLAATFYAPGVVGTRSASQALFGADPARIGLSESAELLAAESYFPQYRACKNPARLELLRDAVIDRMTGFGVIKESEGNRAKKRKVSCTTRP